MMKHLTYIGSSLLLSGFAFAARQAEAAPPDLPTQIMQGFNAILAGSLGLKLAVAIVFVAGFAIGWWKEAHGAF